MIATELEFRHRFWSICFVYFVGFGFYRFDHLNVVDALARWIFSTSDPDLNSVFARHLLHASFALSAALTTAAAWVRTWGAAYLQIEVVHGEDLHAEKLVADGPYRHVRNPLYLGGLLLAVGMAMLASRTGAFVIVVGQSLIVLRLIGREEAALMQAQGESYRAFLAAVPRLWPSLRPRLPVGGMQPRWVQAFLGEAWLWTFALNGFLFSWKMNLHLYGTILWVSGAAYFLMRMGMKRWR